MVKIGLNMIVKNEAHIIKESLRCTLPLIDTYVIVDTGSTDNTIEIIKNFYKEHGIVGDVYERPWKNFGHNRSEALKLCDGKMDYCLVIDADDLINFPNNGKEILNKIIETEKPNNIDIRIHEGGIKYSRGQIFKANDNWGYIGVLHEYASNKKQNNKSIHLPDDFYMTSRRLGGRNLVGDKQKKDIEVLEQGIKDEPDNDRYMYYLAQSYLDYGDVDNALKWYKKRFKIGRWYEEAFHAAYNVGKCYLRKGNFIKFEEWMQKAHKFHPKRAEPIYELASFFRKTGQFYKAYHYIQIGRQIPYPKDDLLFIEQFPHTGGFDYEASIVEFYTHSDKKVGLRSSIQYLLKKNEFQENVVSNMKFYTTAISDSYEKINIPEVFGSDFRPSAISISDYPFANVRFVNYLTPLNGEYKTKDGSPIQTQNAYINLETGECLAEMQQPPVKFESTVRGLEDLRLYKKNNDFYFTATSYQEYIENTVSIVHGKYDIESKCMKECIGIESPFKHQCEKNWINIPNTDEFIYSWHPFLVGKIIKNRYIFNKKIDTPPLFKLFRGSAPPMKVDDNWLCLVHFVDYEESRKYYHCFVEFDKKFNMKRVSLPFFFKNLGIEYCISTRKINDVIECYISINDGNPHKVTINTTRLDWINIQ